MKLDLKNLAAAFPDGLLSDGKEIIHTLSRGTDYYDLLDRTGSLLCINGESCRLLRKNAE